MKDSRLPRLRKTILTLSLIPTCILFYSCSGPAPAPSGSDSRPANTAPASAPGMVLSSKQLVAADPRGQYLIIKQTLAGLAPQPEDPSPSEIYSLEDCKTGRDFIGVSQDELIEPLANLAYMVVHLRKTLVTLGYPESVWSSQLTQFENRQFDLLLSEVGQPYSDDSPSQRNQEGFKKKIVQELNDYREESPDLPEVTYEDGCGAGEVNIELRTDPAGGRATLIPVFFYELCKAQQLDPENEAQCKWWLESAAGLPLEVSGDYYIRGTWSDGLQKLTRMNFDPAQEGQIITITKP